VPIPPGPVSVDLELLDEAVKVGGRRSRRDTLNEALKEYIERRRRLELTKYFGKVEFRTDWDYKKDRRKR
jgi:hypothetical protein